jgi:hypothetical protein
MAAMAVATASASRIFARPSEFEAPTPATIEARWFLSSKFGGREIDRQEHDSLIASGLSAVIGHDVRVRIATRDQSEYLTCTCPGGKFAWAGDKQGAGCWAMKRVRAERAA